MTNDANMHIYIIYVIMLSVITGETPKEEVMYMDRVHFTLCGSTSANKRIVMARS